MTISTHPRASALAAQTERFQAISEQRDRLTPEELRTRILAELPTVRTEPDAFVRAFGLLMIAGVEQGEELLALLRETLSTAQQINDSHQAVIILCRTVLQIMEARTITDERLTIACYVEIDARGFAAKHGAQIARY